MLCAISASSLLLAMLSTRQHCWPNLFAPTLGCKQGVITDGRPTCRLGWDFRWLCFCCKGICQQSSNISEGKEFRDCPIQVVFHQDVANWRSRWCLPQHCHCVGHHCPGQKSQVNQMLSNTSDRCHCQADLMQQQHHEFRPDQAEAISSCYYSGLQTSILS